MLLGVTQKFREWGRELEREGRSREEEEGGKREEGREIQLVASPGNLQYISQKKMKSGPGCLTCL